MQESHQPRKVTAISAIGYGMGDLYGGGQGALVATYLALFWNRFCGMDIGLTRIVDDASLTVEKLHASLTALSPQSTLDRGYAVVQNADGHVIDDAGKVSAGDHLTLTLRKGVITATAQ